MSPHCLHVVVAISVPVNFCSEGRTFSLLRFFQSAPDYLRTFLFIFVKQSGGGAAATPCSAVHFQSILFSN